MPDEDENRRWDPLPLIALAVIVMLLLAGWWLFPAVQEWLAGKDCIASGRTNCFSAGVVGR
jgi:hypothetical protein